MCIALINLNTTEYFVDDDIDVKYYAKVGQERLELWCKSATKLVNAPLFVSEKHLDAMYGNNIKSQKTIS